MDCHKVSPWKVKALLYSSVLLARRLQAQGSLHACEESLPISGKWGFPAEVTGLGAHCREASWRRGGKEGEPELGGLTPGNGHRFTLDELPLPSLPPSEFRSWGIRKRRVFCNVSQSEMGKNGGEIHRTYRFTHNELGLLYFNQEEK